MRVDETNMDSCVDCSSGQPRLCSVKIELTDRVCGRLGGWLGDYLVTLLFVKQCLKKYNRSEVKTLHVGTVWWEADAATNNKLISVRQRALPKITVTKKTLPVII